ncbi:leucine-rich repeat domain-containing protein [Nostoc sp. NIES-2111]
MTQEEQIEKRIQEFYKRGDRHLDLSRLELTEVPPQILNLKDLQSLDLRFNNIGDAGTKHLAQLTGLQSLNLRSNNIGDAGAEHLAQLTGLQSLNLPGNDIGDAGAEHLAKLTSLQSLSLSSNYIGDEGAKHLAQLTSLQSLNLRSNNIGDAGAEHLAKLTGLQSLYLSGNNIGDAGAEHLANLKGLQILSLSVNHIGDAGMAHLAQLTGLRSLNLRSNNISDAGVEHLARLTNLLSLELSHNMLSDAGAEHLAKLVRLQSLDLSSNMLGNAGAEYLAQITGLQSLDLSSNMLGDDGAKHLAQLTDLQSLYLSSNRLGDDGAKHLAQITGLQSLYLSNNRLNDDAAEYLLKLRQLRTLRIQNCSISDKGIRSLALKLPLLQTIDFRENPTTSIPKDLLDNFKALQSYLTLRENETVKNTKAKVLLTGNPDSGKSSMVEWLQKGKLTNKRRNAPTHGMFVVEWIVDNNLQIRFWDFGGQDYYHATHSLFMRDAMLHICMHTCIQKPKSRNRADDLYFKPPYWLGNIAYYSSLVQDEREKAPIWFLNTHADIEGFAQVWLDGNEDSTSPIEECYSTSTHAPNKGIRRFKEDLLEYLKDRVGKIKLDAAWVEIRDNHLPEWRELGIWVLSEAGFREKCQEADNRLRDEGRYSGLLKVLGGTGEIVVLESSWDAVGKVVFLSPEILVKKIYEVLSLNSRSGGGQLKIADTKKYSADEMSVIVDILSQSDLIFPDRKRGEGHYIVPQYLPDNVHADHFARLIPLTLVLKYEGYMPMALIPSFITLFAGSDDDSFYWKYGAFFTYNTKEGSVSAFVRMDVKKLRVYIHIEDKRGRLELLRKIVGHFWQRPENKRKKEISELTKIIIDYIVSTDRQSNSAYDSDSLDIHAFECSLARASNLIPKLSISLENMTFGDSEQIVGAILDGSKHYSCPDRHLAPLHPLHYQLFGGPEYKMPKNIFLSYAHADESSKDQLDRHFEALRKSGKIETWHDRRILPGDKFDPTIKGAMEKADIFLLLISVDFMNSRYIWNEEIKYAVDNKRTIIPIFLHPCDFVETEYGIGENQGIPRDKGKGIRWVHSSHWQYPQEAYLEIVNEIKALL